MPDVFSEEQASGVPTLVQMCQKVLVANIDSISSFGTGTPFRLIEPILKACSADILERLESETPPLEERTSDLWKDLCLKTYPLANLKLDQSTSWKELFFSLKHKEERRFEEAASRARSQRLEAEESRRKRQAQLTHHLPDPKRSRSNLPKTLFEKTRQEATRIQKSMFGSRTARPFIGASGSRARFSTPTSQILPRNQVRNSDNTATMRGSGSRPTAVQTTQIQPSRNYSSIPTPLTKPGTSSMMRIKGKDDKT